MARKLTDLRNIGVIAHIDAGKTTVTERMLFYAKASHRMGDVDKGTTVTDFDPEEQERGITIYSACVTFNWAGVVVNLIDTPGHVDFTAEVERSLRVLDGGVVVFSAREGVEAQSETVWRQADKYGVPRICFINKMDREGANFEGTLKEIRDRLGANPVAVQIPVGAGPSHVQNPFRAIVDLVEMELLTFSGEAQGSSVVRGPIPEDLRDEVDLWREQLLTQLFDYSNELAELMLEESPVPADLIRRVLRDATLHRMIVPVLCGAALDFIGIQPLLDGVAAYLPSPADIPPVTGLDPKDKDRKLIRRVDASEPFCGLVFKILAHKHGDLHYVRIYSGQLKANSRVLNPGRGEKENAAQLWHIQADRKDQVPLAEAGDIVGLIGPRHSITGDTLCDTREPILLESIEFPETVISMAIEPESSLDRKKLAETLDMMRRQDPTFRASESEDTGQTLISGMGELHLEVIKHRLLRDFNLNVRVHRPRVSYKESVAASVEVLGECQRQISGQNLFAQVKIRISPKDGDRPCSVESRWFSESSAVQSVINVALDALRGQAEGGGLLGCPLWDCAVELLEVPLEEPYPTEIALRIAAADAFDKALKQADNVLLEPIMELEVSVPEENLGDIISDLQQRRALITNTYARGVGSVVEAEAPLAMMFGYSMAVRSLSQGRASFSMSPLRYGPAPDDVKANYI